MNQKEKSFNTKRQIAYAAMQLFGTKGYEQTSLMDIADVIHMSKAEEQLAKVCEDIKLRVHRKTKKRNYVLAAVRNVIQPHFVNELPEKDKGFVVSDDCIACGLCSKVCIANNIKIENGKPIFQH